MDTPDRIENFPVSFFAMIMGMSGLTIAWQKASHVLGVSSSIATPLVLLTSLLFISLVFLYIRKLAGFRQAVIEELRYPVKLNFFPAISISLILLSVVFLHIQCKRLMNDRLAHLILI